MKTTKNSQKEMKKNGSYLEQASLIVSMRCYKLLKVHDGQDQQPEKLPKLRFLISLHELYFTSTACIYQNNYIKIFEW